MGTGLDVLQLVTGNGWSTATFVLAAYVTAHAVRALTGTGGPNAPCPVSSWPPTPWR
ncbi:hypothetical protein ACWGJ0_26095 [Streptomyces massasporeus]